MFCLSNSNVDNFLTSMPTSFIQPLGRTLKYSTYLILWWKIGSTVNGFESWCQKNRHRPPPASCGGLHKTHVDFVHGCITFHPQNFQPQASTQDFLTPDTSPGIHRISGLKYWVLKSTFLQRIFIYFAILWAPLEVLLPKRLVWPGNLNIKQKISKANYLSLNYLGLNSSIKQKKIFYHSGLG